MTICLRQIIGYKQLAFEVENMRYIFLYRPLLVSPSLSCKSRSEPFNDGNLEHEMELLQLWTLLKPDTPLEKRVTKQWQSIGMLSVYVQRCQATSPYHIYILGKPSKKKPKKF